MRLKNIDDFQTVTAGNTTYLYFYKRLKADYCGNSRYQVYVLDTDAGSVSEYTVKSAAIDKDIRADILAGRL